MVAEQLAARGIKDPLVLDAMRAVPREEFEWVAFVPLVGAHGWPADATSGARRLPEPQTGG
jgi:protein-L-isoaspartate O-methyltransferase